MNERQTNYRMKGTIPQFQNLEGKIHIMNTDTQINRKKFLSSIDSYTRH